MKRIHKNTSVGVNPLWAKTEYICQGKSYDIWERYSIQSGTKDKPHIELIDWKDISQGEIVTVGWLDKRPVNLSVNWDWLDGHLFLFYEPCSQVVDWVQIDSWLDENFFKLYNKERYDHHSNFFNLVLHYRRAK